MRTARLMSQALPSDRPFGRPLKAGLTFIELMIGAMILVVAIVALLSSFFSQITLNEQIRNRAWALNDAARVMERIRRQNSGGSCLVPTATQPAGFANWDAWLADATASGGGGKSVSPGATANELIVVTPIGSDPLQVTVAVCWRQRSRTIGECTWSGSALIASPALGGNPAITESPAMLSSLITCRL